MSIRRALCVSKKYFAHDSRVVFFEKLCVTVKKSLLVTASAQNDDFLPSHTLLHPFN